MKRFLYLICILIMATDCKEVYEAPPQALLLASFANSTTSNDMNSIITAQGIGLDSLLYNEASMSDMLLPLTINDTTRYIVWFDSKSDSIIFVHETTQKYASMESGFYFEYKLKSIRFTQNRIDSVRIIDSLVTTKWNENIKLYLHPLPVSSN